MSPAHYLSKPGGGGGGWGGSHTRTGPGRPPGGKTLPVVADLFRMANVYKTPCNVFLDGDTLGEDSGRLTATQLGRLRWREGRYSTDCGTFN